MRVLRCEIRKINCCRRQTRSSSTIFSRRHFFHHVRTSLLLAFVARRTKFSLGFTIRRGGRLDVNSCIAARPGCQSTLFVPLTFFMEQFGLAVDIYRLTARPRGIKNIFRLSGCSEANRRWFAAALVPGCFSLRVKHHCGSFDKRDEYDPLNSEAFSRKKREVASIQRKLLES